MAMDGEKNPDAFLSESARELRFVSVFDRVLTRRFRVAMNPDILCRTAIDESDVFGSWQPGISGRSLSEAKVARLESLLSDDCGRRARDTE